MNLLHLRYFKELAHTLHYTRAAENLFIAQPSLSHAIAQLEAELGVPLFDKKGKTITLTQFGKEFLEHTEQALTTLDEAIDSLQKASKGEGLIRLGLLRTLGEDFVPSIAAKFLEANPGKDFKFTFNTGVTQQLLEGLKEKKYDLVFASSPPEELGFSAIPVHSQDLVLITPRNHPLAQYHSVTLEQTLPYPQVYFSKGSGLRAVVDNLYDQIDGKPEIAYETEEDRVVAGLVANGFGIAIVPYMDMLLRIDVKILQISEPAWERNFYLICNDRAYLAPAAREFRRYVLEKSAL